MTGRHWYWLRVTLLPAGCILFSVGCCLRQMALAAAGIVLWVAAIAADLQLWRCPHCGVTLGRITPAQDRFCPHCGEKLDWEEKWIGRK